MVWDRRIEKKLFAMSECAHVPAGQGCLYYTPLQQVLVLVILDSVYDFVPSDRTLPIIHLIKLHGVWRVRLEASKRTSTW